MPLHISLIDSGLQSMYLQRNPGSPLTTSNHRHLPCVMDKLMQIDESQEEDTSVLCVAEMGFYVKCSFLFGAHPHPLQRQRGGAFKLHTCPFVGYSKVKTKFKQGSNRDAIELLGNPTKQSWDQYLPLCHPHCGNLLSGEPARAKRGRSIFWKEKVPIM